MTSLHGLENLETVGGLFIDDSVEDLDALSNLRSVGGGLTLSNLGIQAINLPNLCAIDGDLRIIGNSALERLDLEGHITIEGTLSR